MLSDLVFYSYVDLSFYLLQACGYFNSRLDRVVEEEALNYGDD